MKLTVKELSDAALGAVSVREDGFHRFTAAEEEMYKKLDEACGRSDYKTALCPAGVRLSFITDSRSLRIKANVTPKCRHYFSFDIFENGKPIACVKNFNEEEITLPFASVPFPTGKIEEVLPLSEGEKQLTVYLPCLVTPEELEFYIDDGASFAPAPKPKKKLLVYGDSITQGYDALHPHNRYAARLADALGAEEINKGIGGEVFRPALAEHKADFVPDYITVAYGTNDWSKIGKEDFTRNCKEFFTKLSENYPTSRIFAITPIWRADNEEERNFGKLSEVGAYIKEVAATLINVTAIDGIDLVPHETELYADLRLHPWDKGFDYYFENLREKILKEIEG